MKYVIDCISDTHTMHDRFAFPVPEIDGEYTWLLVHGGDYTHRGRATEVASFATWFRKQPHPHKIFINGNHECLADPVWRDRLRKTCLEELATSDGMYETSAVRGAKTWLRQLKRPVDVRKAMAFAHYLEDTEVTIEGLRIHGSPYSLEFCEWGYSVDPKDAAAKWESIPAGLDVLVVHGPPKWHGDRCPAFHDKDKLVFVGDEALLNRIRVVKPRVVICGHIHEGHGVYVDGDIIIVNAACAFQASSNGMTVYKTYKDFHRIVIDDVVTVTSIPVTGS